MCRSIVTNRWHLYGSSHRRRLRKFLHKMARRNTTNHLRQSRVWLTLGSSYAPLWKISPCSLAPDGVTTAARFLHYPTNANTKTKGRGVCPGTPCRCTMNFKQPRTLKEGGKKTPSCINLNRRFLSLEWCLTPAQPHPLSLSSRPLTSLAQLSSFNLSLSCYSTPGRSHTDLLFNCPDIDILYSIPYPSIYTRARFQNSIAVSYATTIILSYTTSFLLNFHVRHSRNMWIMNDIYLCVDPIHLKIWRSLSLEQKWEFEYPDLIFYIYTVYSNVVHGGNNYKLYGIVLYKSTEDSLCTWSKLFIDG
jgi:hypothetical protein